MSSKRILSLAVICLLFASCGGFVPTGDAAGITTTGGATGGGTGGSVPTFAQVQPIIAANCGACHGAGDPNNAQFDCSSEDSIRAAAASVGSAIKAQLMPPSTTLDAADAALVESWCENGTP